MQVFNKIWQNNNATCGNIFRVQWDDGTETGYPTEEIRDRAISALAKDYTTK